MSSHRAVLAFFTDKVPVLRLSTSYASALKFIGSFFGAHTPIFVVTKHMGVLTFHAFSGLSHPEIRRVACNTDIVWREVWSL